MQSERRVNGYLPRKIFFKTHGREPRDNKNKTHAQVYDWTPDETTHHPVDPLIMDGNKAKQIQNHRKSALAVENADKSFQIKHG